MRDRVETEMNRVSGEPGTGGEAMELSVNMGTDTDLTITGITCRGGPGTMYRIAVSAPHYRDYSFFQLIQENVVNTASDDVEFWVKPGDVREIRAPSFNELPAPLRAILAGADVRREAGGSRLAGRLRRVPVPEAGAATEGLPA